MSESRRQSAAKAEDALIGCLKKCRDEIAAHGEVGEGDKPIPRAVYYAAMDAVEALDRCIETLLYRDADVRDEGIDDAIDALGR